MKLPFAIEEKEENIATGDTLKNRKVIKYKSCPCCEYDRFLYKEFYVNGILKTVSLKECMNPNCDYCIDEHGEQITNSTEKAIKKTMF